MSLKKAFLFLAAAGYVAALLAVGYGTIIGLRQFAGGAKPGRERLRTPTSGRPPRLRRP